MMYSDYGQVYAEGTENVLRAEYSYLTNRLAERFGKDKFLESALFGIYAERKDQVDRIHEILKEGGMDV